jgi:hypothetical protein
VAISSASPVNTRTAEWIATRSKRKMSLKEAWLFTVVKSINIIFSANVRSAVRVFTGEAGQRNPCGLAGTLHLRSNSGFCDKTRSSYF